MVSTIKGIVSEPWVSTVLGLLGLVLAYYFYRKSKRRPELAVQRSEVAIVGGGSTAFPSDLQIFYGDIAVPRVTATSIMLWNSGNETIHGNQILEGDKLRVEVSEGEVVLQAQLLRSTREVNGLQATVDLQSKRIANISFDYLDPGDGAALELLHTDSRDKLLVKGTLRGLPKGISDLGKVNFDKNLTSSNVRLRRFAKPMAVIGSGLLFVMMGLYGQTVDAFFGTDVSDQAFRNFMMGTLTGIGSLYLLLGFWFLWRTRKRYPVKLAPAGLDAPAVVQHAADNV